MRKIKLLLKQHVGAPCAAIVKPGDKVEKGTLIATPTGLGANIFSSVYGTVEEVNDQAIVILPEDEQPDRYIPIKKSDNKLDMVKEAGIVGMGGAGFPTGVKLAADLEGGYILVNAAECEPGLRHNIMQLEQQAEKTVRGVEYCMEMSNAKKAIFAIKRKNARAISAIKKAIANKPDISIHLLPDIYPMGEERAVVRECLGILLGPTQLPSAAHANVVNCETVLRVAEAIEDQKPCICKNISVVGKVHGGPEAQVFMDMPVGISVEDMLEKVGGIDGEYGEIIMGGAFTGLPTTLEAPTTKTTGAIMVTVPFLDLHGAKVGQVREPRQLPRPDREGAGDEARGRRVSHHRQLLRLLQYRSYLRHAEDGPEDNTPDRPRGAHHTSPAVQAPDRQQDRGSGSERVLMHQRRCENGLWPLSRRKKVFCGLT